MEQRLSWLRLPHGCAEARVWGLVDGLAYSEHDAHGVGHNAPPQAPLSASTQVP